MKIRRRHTQSRALEADADAVCRAAGLLDVAEYHLFELAHREWFGEDPAEPAIRASFRVYVQTGAVPFWLRQFVRRVREGESEGTLHPADFGVAPPPVSARERRLGWVLIVVLAFAVPAYGWVLTWFVGY